MIVVQPRGGDPVSFTGPFTIGRLLPEPGADPGATLQLDDPRVALLHARVAMTGAGWVITDLMTPRGTRVNGLAIGAGGMILRKGDIISVGDSELVVVPDPP